ncbi:hypothetical protein CEXT_218401 [Caerostris extrusa]|nr:hypothetical protein CEXT_218401 [Caerostris extrusa]
MNAIIHMNISLCIVVDNFGRGFKGYAITLYLSNAINAMVKVETFTDIAPKNGKHLQSTKPRGQFRTKIFVNCKGMLMTVIMRSDMERFPI